MTSRAEVTTKYAKAYRRCDCLIVKLNPGSQVADVSHALGVRGRRVMERKPTIEQCHQGLHQTTISVVHIPEIELVLAKCPSRNLE